MSEQEYQTLWNYSEQFSRDKLQRSELITMAWKEGVRLGVRCTPGLMKSHMHFRSKELNIRSAFPAKEVGKRTIDAYNRPHRLHLEQPLVGEEQRTVGDVVLNTYTTPIDFAITNDFLNSLSEQERTILEDLSAGYTAKEIKDRNHLNNSRLKSIRHDLETKAVEYLM
jgi:hypothetical protein